MSKAPLRVLVTGAAGQIGYSLIPLVASGEMLGADQPVILHLLDIPRAAEGLKGVAMEIDDCAYPLVHGVVCATDVATGFKDVDVAILLGGFPRLDGMTRADLLQKNKAIFYEQGKALADHAKETCKILVIANPANTNCLIAYKSMIAAGGKIPRTNFTAMMRLDQNRAVTQVAQKAGVQVTSVKNVTIWGNHSADQCPDVHNATIDGKPADEVINDAAWVNETFRPLVQNRGAAVIKQRGKSSAASAANAAKDHIRDWTLGTPQGEHVAMAVLTDGTQYGVPKDLCFSFPCFCKDGEWQVVPGLDLTDDVQAALKVNSEKLQEEIVTAMKEE
jgi:malate dehydrogenase